jgi:uncharacterized protein YkwD
MRAAGIAISSRRWLSIARFFAVIPVVVALAVSAVATSSPRPAAALDSEEQAFLTIVNNYRAQHGLGALSLDPQLNSVARWMADDLANNNYFSHTDSLGRDPFQRMDDMGYTYNTWRGENLAAGTVNAQPSFQMWSDSPGHNANMLGEHYTVIGIARAYNANSDFGWYWATEFGGATAPAPAPAPPPPAPTAQPQPKLQPQPTAAPVAPQPVTQANEASEPAPPPAPTNTPAPKVRVIPAGELEATWWRSLLTIGEKWDVSARDDSFVSAVSLVLDAFEPGPAD